MYQGQPLTRKIADEIIRNQLKGSGNITEIAACVLKTHEKHGGLPPDPTDERRSDRALESIITVGSMIVLCSNGYVEQVSDDRWKIHESPLRVFGKGSGCVYLYYNPINRDDLSTSWVCKVGKHKKSGIKAVRTYVDKATRNWSVPATLALILKTDNYKKLEKQIQTILKDVLDRQHKRDNASREMYMTSPDQVIKIYKFLKSMKMDYG